MKKSDFDDLLTSVQDMANYSEFLSPVPSRIIKYDKDGILLEIMEEGVVVFSLESALETYSHKNISHFKTFSELLGDMSRAFRQTDRGMASFLGIPVSTYRGWKQGRRTPRGPARRLLEISIRYPKALLHTLREQPLDHCS